MIETKCMVKCPVCGNQFQFGPHKYDGKHLDRYEMTVCRLCYDVNWDGWGPAREAAILDHLREKGIPVPDRNQEGLLPRE